MHVQAALRGADDVPLARHGGQAVRGHTLADHRAAGDAMANVEQMVVPDGGVDGGEVRGEVGLIGPAGGIQVESAVYAFLIRAAGIRQGRGELAQGSVESGPTPSSSKGPGMLSMKRARTSLALRPVREVR